MCWGSEEEEENLQVQLQHGAECHRGKLSPGTRPRLGRLRRVLQDSRHHPGDMLVASASPISESVESADHTDLCLCKRESVTENEDSAKPEPNGPFVHQSKEFFGGLVFVLTCF